MFFGSLQVGNYISSTAGKLCSSNSGRNNRCERAKQIIYSDKINKQ